MSLEIPSEKLGAHVKEKYDLASMFGVAIRLIRRL